MRSDPLPPPLLDGSFRVSDALAHVPYQRLRRGDVWLVARGLRAPRALAEVERARLVAPILGPRQYLSHTTAAALWGIPVPHDDLVHTTTIGSGTVTRRPGFVGHRVTPRRAKTSRVRGIPVSERVEAWAECSTLLNHEQLVIAGDFLVGHDCRHGEEELEAAVRVRRGRRGARALRAALADIRVGSESPRETRLRLQLVRDGIRMPLLNCEIHDEAGRFVARPDLIFGRERVCVEYDGDHHRTDRTTYRDDKRRREALADNGWHTLYVSDDDLRGAHWVVFLRRLRRALARGHAAAARRAERSP